MTMRWMMGRSVGLALVLAAAGSALAGPVAVLEARAERLADLGDNDLWRFDVTLEHADTGWDHYADRFEVLDDRGALLGTRTLFHPHVDEQPFTRSLMRVEIPKTVTRVTIRGHDSVHGYGEAKVTLDLPR